MAEVKERLAEPLISANLSIGSNAKLRTAFHSALSHRRRIRGHSSLSLSTFVLLNVQLSCDMLHGCSSLEPNCRKKVTKTVMLLVNVLLLLFFGVDKP